MALAHQEIIPAILPPWAHYLVAYGPMFSALVVTGISQGPSGLKELGGSIFKVMSTIVIVWAVLVIIFAKSKSLMSV